MHRSYLFAPGHNAKLLGKVFDAGADAVMLDLEDAVPPDAKAAARALVAETLADRVGWVRINAVRSRAAEADLEAIAGLAAGIRVPKVESAEDVQWVVDRAWCTPLICAVERAARRARRGGGRRRARRAAPVDGRRRPAPGSQRRRG